eukprot:Lankesteria_metandrocarpae@DN10430_c0_g1_i1.p1
MSRPVSTRTSAGTSSAGRAWGGPSKSSETGRRHHHNNYLQKQHSANSPQYSSTTQRNGLDTQLDSIQANSNAVQLGKQYGTATFSTDATGIRRMGMNNQTGFKRTPAEDGTCIHMQSNFDIHQPTMGLDSYGRRTTPPTKQPQLQPSHSRTPISTIDTMNTFSKGKVMTNHHDKSHAPTDDMRRNRTTSTTANTTTTNATTANATTTNATTANATTTNATT